MEILLASQSPRRQELLQSMGYDFTVVSIDCNEVYGPEIQAQEVASYLSKLKSDTYKNLEENQLLITADTVVVHQGEVLGKPKDEADAKQMLKQLSGSTHQVYTACSLKSSQKSITFCDMAQVSLLELSDEEIAYYIKNHHPMDKAGSYGVQDWLGMAKIKEIVGSYYTIMGLPTHLLYEHLSRF